MVQPDLELCAGSSFHKMMSRGTMLVTVKGWRSGRPIGAPTSYLQDENTLWVVS